MVQCPRCIGGSVIKDGDEVVCLNCGWRPVEAESDLVPHWQDRWAKGPRSPRLLTKITKVV